MARFQDTERLARQNVLEARRIWHQNVEQLQLLIRERLVTPAAEAGEAAHRWLCSEECQALTQSVRVFARQMKERDRLLRAATQPQFVSPPRIGRRYTWDEFRARTRDEPRD